MKIRSITLCLIVIFAFTMISYRYASASEVDILVKKLVEKGILTPEEATVLKADAREEAAKEVAEQKKSLAIPEWTQKIKVKGDVRFRTQMDWGKSLHHAHQEVRNRIRARIGLEGKVNDQISAGVRWATGSSSDPRSTNQTLDGLFREKQVWFDKMWIKWNPELPESAGKGDVLLGKFGNPFKVSELMWDGDINPEGVALQYASPTFSGNGLPDMSLYGNFGMFWLDEISTSESDAMLYGFQGGIKMLLNRDWGSNLDFAVAYWDTANAKNKNSLQSESAGTNTTWASGTPNYAGNLRYDYNTVDFLLTIDNKRFFDLEVPNGLYGDCVWNAAVNKDAFAFQAGAYIGNKKLKKPGDWKVWGEYRYIERDAILDTLPDSDFYGFTRSGLARGGGTNASGFNGGMGYTIMKNTVLSAEYYYCTPLDINSTLAGAQDEPYQLLQLDVNVKF